MNLATMTQAPTNIDVGGKTYRIGPFRYLELGICQRHLDETSPHPAPQVGDDRWASALFSSLDGVALFLNLLFAKHQDLGEDGLSHIMAHVGPRQIGPLFDVAMEVDPRESGPAEGTKDGPKGEPARSTT